MNYEQQLIRLLKYNIELNEIFHILKKNHLSNAFVCSGTIRTIVWNILAHKKTNLVLENIDVIYADTSETYEEFLTKKAVLSQNFSKYFWNLENVCLNNKKSMQPFGKNISLALETIPETCNSIAVNFNNSKSELIAPFSLDHLFDFEVHPTPRFQQDSTILAYYKSRVTNKKWQAKWPSITFFAD